MEFLFPTSTSLTHNWERRPAAMVATLKHVSSTRMETRCGISISQTTAVRLIMGIRINTTILIIRPAERRKGAQLFRWNGRKMRTVGLSMHRGNCNSLQLVDILSVIPGDGLNWSILDFYGVGRPPGGETMAEFEERVRGSAIGHRISWPELRDFANDLEQTIDCTIVAAESEEELRVLAQDVDNDEKLRVMIRALDSTKWEVKIRDSNLESAARIGDALDALRYCP